ncbi:hypothetical protein [Acidomonas methanolica]|uniref:hypothetical protein n=1 Tax=Acidomonas methanolica TaxID=437 RepID=UPI002119C3BB|nr:hypothetical protein [Acidomonas methanolica]MCQ9154150.1 hypothetical protein [Acidomonas methanolica]
MSLSRGVVVSIGRVMTMTAVGCVLFVFPGAGQAASPDGTTGPKAVSHVAAAKSVTSVGAPEVIRVEGAPERMSWLSRLFDHKSTEDFGDAPVTRGDYIHHGLGRVAAPAGLPGARMMAAGHVSLMFMPSFMGMQDNMVGDSTVSPATIATHYDSVTGSKVRVVPHGMNASMYMFGVMYAVNNWLNIDVMSGWTRKYMDMTTFKGMVGSKVLGMSGGATSGFNDTQVDAIVRFYQDRHTHLHLNFGLSLPSGSTTGAITMLSPKGKDMTTRAPYGMQIGTGEVFATPGLTYLGTTGRWSWGAAFRSRIPFARNNHGYAWGARYQESVWGGYLLPGDMILSLRVNYVRQDRISGKDPLINGVGEPMNPLYYGGQRLQLLGGLDIDGHSIGLPGYSHFAIEGGKPVYQNLYGPQLAQGWQIAARISQLF